MLEDNKSIECSPQAEDGILDLAIVLLEQKKLLFGLPAIVVTIALATTFLIQNSYTATTKVLPPQQSTSNAVSILGQLGSIGSSAGAALGLKNPNDVYLAMLKSRSVAEKIINRFKLKDVYEEKYFEDTIRKLEKHSRILAGKDGVIIIEVDDIDPARAANIANSYIDELDNLTMKLAVNEAGRRRLFFERQLTQTKENLIAAETAIEQFRSQTKIVAPEQQGALTVSAAASVRAQIVAKEIQLQSIYIYATDNNADLIRLKNEIQALKAQLSKFEENNDITSGDVLVPLKKSPETSLKYVRLIRELKYQETLFELLAKQYELAKLDEAKNATLIQVLDKATPPEKKSWPKRTIITLLAALIGQATSILIILARNHIKKNMANPDFAMKIIRARENLFS